MGHSYQTVTLSLHVQTRRSAIRRNQTLPEKGQTLFIVARARQIHQLLHVTDAALSQLTNPTSQGRMGA